MSFTARQRPNHSQGTVIWHLTCSRASLDPAGEHHNLFLRLGASQVSCLAGFWFSPALLVVNSYCVARVQGKSAQVLWGQGEELMIPLCWNRLSRSECHPVGGKYHMGHPGDMGVPNQLLSATVWDSRGFRLCDWGLWSCPLEGCRCPALCSWRTCQLISSSLQDKLNLALLITRSLKAHWGLVL